MMTDPHFLPGVPVDHVLTRLAQAGGKEIESGKFSSPESSAALAANCFAWFTLRPEHLPSLPGLADAGTPELVDIEFCARFPWSGGRHPWLDAVVQTPAALIGVESKRFEPFRDAKTVNLSAAYDRPVWGDRMQAFERMRDHLRAGSEKFVHLDAAQLVKHAFGLVTEGRRRARRPVLFYLYAEPETRNGRPISQNDILRHRDEIARFGTAIAGDEVLFHSASYRDWIRSWHTSGDDVVAHGETILREFTP